jgi:hypothetical protein
LYGKHVDPRYADFHVFAFDEKGEAVGCYALIPIKVIARGQTIWAGKGEGLYMKEGHRAKALFLIRCAVTFAIERGLHLQFGFTNERLTRMLRLLGFTPLPVMLDHSFRLLRPGDISQISSSRIRLISAHGVSAAQSIIGSAAKRFQRNREVSFAMNCAEHLDPIFKTISRIRSGSNGYWSVAIDEDSLRWWNSIGCLDVLSLDPNTDEFVAFTRGARGNSSEIIQWNVRNGGLARAVLILQFIVQKAMRDGAATVSAGASADLYGTLQKAAAALGFLPWRAKRTMYVRANDPFFLDSRNLLLNSLFNI